MNTCPRCDGVALTDDECSRCQGAWYDRGELERAIIAPAPPEHTPQTALPTRYLKCPVCAAIMTPRNWERRSGVIVDVCTAHGAWLDGGELSRLRVWAASARRERGPSADAEAARLERSIVSYGAGTSARAHSAGYWSLGDELAAVFWDLFGRNG